MDLLLVNIKRLDFKRTEDCDLLYDALYIDGASILALSGKLGHELMDPEPTYDFLSSLDTVYTVGPYLVAYAIHMPWYSYDEVLCDLLVMRITADTGSLSDVTDFLEAEARANNVKFVAVGTLLAPNDKALVRAYERQGYSIAATQLVKEIT